MICFKDQCKSQCDRLTVRRCCFHLQQYYAYMVVSIEIPQPLQQAIRTVAQWQAATGRQSVTLLTGVHCRQRRTASVKCLQRQSFPKRRTLLSVVTRMPDTNGKHRSLGQNKKDHWESKQFLGGAKWVLEEADTAGLQPNILKRTSVFCKDKHPCQCKNC